MPRDLWGPLSCCLFIFGLKHFLICGNRLLVPSALSAVQHHNSNAVLCVLMKLIHAEHVNNMFSYIWIILCSLQALHVW